MRAQRSAPRARLAIECLEERTVPTTATFTANGTLTVMGTGSDDQIHVSNSGGQINVSGVGQSFTGVGTLVIDAAGGNDTVVVDPNVTANTYIYGGDGNDAIQGGGGVNHIFGGAGNDTVTGGTGADEVYGGTGTNVVNGPAGAHLVAGSPMVTTSPTAQAQQVLDLVNQQRAANGLAPLTMNSQLTAAAAEQSNSMANLAGVFNDYNAAMQHTLIGSPAPTMQDRAALVGYDYFTYGENIAYGYSDPASVMNAWMNSAGHRANILNPSFTQIGIAQAVTADGVVYWTQEFGLPSGNTGGGTVGTSPPVTPPTTTNPPVTTSPPTNNPQPPTNSPPQTPTSGYGAGPTMAGKIYAVGGDSGSNSTLTVYDAASGAVKFYTQPYGTSFRGGLRVATGDLTGDGSDDIVVAPGAGTTPLVRIYDGVSGQEVREFLAYDPSFTDGVNVAVGDVNGDGRLDIITGADSGGGPHVKVFDGATGQQIRSFFAYNPTFGGGVRVAAGDVNGDGKTDIITGAGPGGGPHVEVWDGATGLVMRSFFAYAPNFIGGVHVGAGDLNGDGRADVITGAGAGGGPNVKVFDGSSLATISSFFAGSPAFTGGVRVRAMTVNGLAEIVSASGSPDHTVRFTTADGSLLSSFLAGDPSNVSGLFVG
ncbi:MAG: CAP domain-containing protein [Gemmataceae bacterium]